MKTKLTLASALVAVASLAASHAYAGLNPSSLNDGDLLLCFHAAGTGSDLEIDLGTYTSPVSLINVNADLTAVFGSSWYSNTNLTWSVIGADENGGGNYIANEATNDPAAFDTLFLSSPTAVLAAQVQQLQHVPANDIEANYALITSNNATVTANGAYTANGGSGPGYAYSNTPLSDIESYFNAFVPQSGDIGSAGSDSVTMYELQPSDSGNPSSTLGTYTLSGNGNFSTTAVPEPSTWASVALGALALVGFRRRRA